MIRINQSVVSWGRVFYSSTSRSGSPACSPTNRRAGCPGGEERSLVSKSLTGLEGLQQKPRGTCCQKKNANPAAHEQVGIVMRNDASCFVHHPFARISLKSDEDLGRTDTTLRQRILIVQHLQNHSKHQTMIILAEPLSSLAQTAHVI